MKKFIRLLFVVVASSIFCLSGCSKTESDYKSAASYHIKSMHGKAIGSIHSIDINISDNGMATANIPITALLDFGGSAEMTIRLTLDEECNISSCSWCQLGWITE